MDVVTVMTFRPSGKWYATGRARLDTKKLFRETHGSTERRAELLRQCGGACPGLSGRGDSFVIVLIPHDDAEYGFPVMMKEVTSE